MDKSDNDKKFIVIEGNIGAGKTSLCKKLSKDFKVNLVLERFADNPFLPKFYKDPDKFAFQLETSFLIERYDQLKKQLHTPDIFKDFVISDYYFAKSLIFAKNTLKSDEFSLYRKLFLLIYSYVPRPDLYVYLNLPPKKLLQNIAKRGRDYEKNITISYLQKIQNAYFDYFKEQKHFKFLILNTHKVDFIKNNEDYQKLKGIIFDRKFSRGITTINL